MQHLKFSPDSEIILEATNITDTTPSMAIQEAIQFVKEQNLECVDLYYDGFLMSIESDTNLKQLVSEYDQWRSIQTAPVKRSVCSCEMPAKVKGKNECWRCKKPIITI